MTYIRDGSQALELATILSVVGEFSPSSIHILGSERTYKTLITVLSTVNKIRFDDSVQKCRLLSVSGHGAMKSVRLTKSAMPILKSIGAYEYYTASFCKSRFPSTQYNKERNFRVAESVMMFKRAGFEYRPYCLPQLSRKSEQRVGLKGPAFFLGKDLKRINAVGLPKTQFTRMTGLFYANGIAYTVYNTRNSVMRWNGHGEQKTKYDMTELIRLNFHDQDINSAIVFYGSDEVVINTILDIKANEKLELRFSNVYPKIHFIPMTEDGIRQLRLFAIPDWKQALLDVLFEEDTLSRGLGSFEYDAVVDDWYVFSFLDGDIARLINFKNGISRKTDFKLQVVCYPHQVGLIKTYIGDRVKLNVVTLETIEKALSSEEEE